MRKIPFFMKNVAPIGILALGQMELGKTIFFSFGIFRPATYLLNIIEPHQLVKKNMFSVLKGSSYPTLPS